MDNEDESDQKQHLDEGPGESTSYDVDDGLAVENPSQEEVEEEDQDNMVESKHKK